VFGHAAIYGGMLPAAQWRATMLAIHAHLPKRTLPNADPGFVAASARTLIPNVVGLPVESATTVLSAASDPSPRGLGPIVVRTRAVPAANPAQTRGTVAAMSPHAGSVRTPGPLTVTLNVVR
jgi:hypothetical protein